MSVLPENPTQAQLDKFDGGAPGGGGISVLPNNPTQADIDKFNGVAPGSGGGGISVLPNNPTQADIDKFNAPVAPPTVHVAAPTVNVAPPNVTIPINVKGAATATAESPAVTPAVATTIPAATGSSGQWQGGAIHVPGFANGGRVRISGDVDPGFADGGSLGIPAAWPQDISSSPWSTQSMLHKIKEELPPNVVTWLAEHVTKVGLRKRASPVSVIWPVSRSVLFQIRSVSAWLMRPRPELLFRPKRGRGSRGTRTRNGRA